MADDSAEADEMMELMNLRGPERRWGGGGGLHNSAVNELKAESERKRESYLKRQRRDDRLTVKVCCCASGLM